MAEKLIVENRRARHEYQLLDRVEAGLVLTGTEVEVAARRAREIQRAYGDIRDGEIWLVGVHISRTSKRDPSAATIQTATASSSFTAARSTR